jgi:hypothetical protein
VQITPHNPLLRPLSPGLTVVARLLLFAVISGIVGALAQLLGLPRHWAFAAGWIAGLTYLGFRTALSAGPEQRRWRSLLLQLAALIVLTLAVVAILGPRWFAPAS